MSKFLQRRARFRPSARWVILAIPLLIAAFAAPASAWTRPVHASLKGPTPKLLGADVLPSGDSLVSWQLIDRPSRAIQARVVRPDRSTGPIKVIATPGSTPYAPSYAIDSSGDAHYLWDVWDGSNYRARMRTLGANGVLGPAMTVTPAGENARAPVFGFDDSGNAVIAWGDGTHIRSRSVAANGSLGPVQDIAPLGTWWHNALPGVAVNPSGDAVITWAEVQNGSGSPGGRVSAIRRQSDGALGPVVNTDDGRTPTGGDFVGIDQVGDVVFAWAPDQVYVQRWPAAGPLAATQTLGMGAGAASFAAGMDEAGNTLVLWGGGYGSTERWSTVISPTGEVRQTAAEFPSGDGYDVAMTPTGDSVIGWHQDRGAWGDRTWVISRAADDTLSNRTLLAGYDHPTAPLVGLNDSGQAVAAWIAPATAPRVQVSTGP